MILVLEVSIWLKRLEIVFEQNICNHYIRQMDQPGQNKINATKERK